MEAARPAPDRWRLIARWLGVSVASLLLAEELISEDEAAVTERVALDFARSGETWDLVGSTRSGDFFAQTRSLLAESVEGGHADSMQAEMIGRMLERVEKASAADSTPRWQPTELRRNIPSTITAPRAAREAVEFVASGIPERLMHEARLLASELVTSSVQHGAGADEDIGLQVAVSIDKLRVEVWDRSSTSARPALGDGGGFGFTLLAAIASRWGGGREKGFHVTWFELDLPSPGA